MVIDTIVGPISSAPLRAAVRRSRPSSCSRAIVSTITTASSTTKPTLRVRAIKERLSSEKPSTAITAKVPINDTAIARAGIRAVVVKPRKSTTTPTTSSTLCSSDCCTSSMAARMLSERSKSTRTLIAAGIRSRSSGNISRMRWLIATALLPGWRCTASTIERTPLKRLASRSLATLSLTSATSASRIGEPLR